MSDLVGNPNCCFSDADVNIIHFMLQFISDLSQVFESHQPVPAVQPDAGVPQSVDSKFSY